MARVFGVTSSADGISAVVLNSFNTTTTPEISEARNKLGKVTDRKAYSRTTEVQAGGLVDGDVTVKGGDKVSAGTITDGLATNVQVTEVNNDYQQFSCTIDQKDASVNVPYS